MVLHATTHNKVWGIRRSLVQLTDIDWRYKACHWASISRLPYAFCVYCFQTPIATWDNNNLWAGNLKLASYSNTSLITNGMNVNKLVALMPELTSPQTNWKPSFHWHHFAGAPSLHPWLNNMRTGAAGPFSSINRDRSDYARLVEGRHLYSGYLEISATLTKNSPDG